MLETDILLELSCHYTMVQYRKTKEDNCTILLQQCSTFRYIGLPVMHDSGIGIDSGMIPIFAGIGIKNIKIKWNRNWNRNQ